MPKMWLVGLADLTGERKQKGHITLKRTCSILVH